MHTINTDTDISIILMCVTAIFTLAEQEQHGAYAQVNGNNLINYSNATSKYIHLKNK
jgi:hypothetical protein